MGGATIFILVVAWILHWVFKLNIWLSALIAVFLGPIIMVVWGAFFGSKTTPVTEQPPAQGQPAQPTQSEERK
jgi:hypothetical protein